MHKSSYRGAAAFALAACLVVPARAQNPSPGQHYVRPPFALETAPVLVGQYAIASDAELSIVLAVEGVQPQRVFARRSDGRGLAGTWLGAEEVSQSGFAKRELHPDSIHVVGARAFAVWLEDEGGPDDTRLWCSRFESGAWAQAERVTDAGVPASHDVQDFACAMRIGPNGNPYVAMAFSTRDPNSPAIRLFGVVSADGGATFNPPFALSGDGVVPGGDAQAVGGVAVDLKGGEFHVAWSDDRNDPGARREVFYRRALLDWFGTPIFVAPLGTGAFDKQISQKDGAIGGVFGGPALAVDDDPLASGGFAKHVGIAWREDTKGQAFPTLFARASHDSGTNFLLETPVAHTAFAGIAAGDFDFEVLGGRYVVSWEDNARDVGQGSVVVLPPALTEVWRATSDDGSDFSAASSGIVTMISANVDPNAFARDPSIAHSFGQIDAGVIAFLEETGTGVEVRTSFADQGFASSWHLDDYPRVSNAQTLPVARDLRPPRTAYNGRYSNFLVVWQQEVIPESGVYHLMVGGYRPQAMRAIGWEAGSTSLRFRIEHVPFQDSFAFVLISSLASANPAGGVTLPDGRHTGLFPEIFYSVGLANWTLFLAQNDPVHESAETIPIPIPPTLLMPGYPLSCVGVTWGPGGALHVVTDYIQLEA